MNESDLSSNYYVISQNIDMAPIMVAYNSVGEITSYPIDEYYRIDETFKNYHFDGSGFKTRESAEKIASVAGGEVISSDERKERMAQAR